MSPQGHPHLAAGLASQAVLAFREGDHAQAWSLLNQALEMSHHLDELFVAMASEAEAMDYLASTKRFYDDLMTCSFSVPDSTDLSYAHIWRRKAMIARLLQGRQSSLFKRASVNSAGGQMLKEW